MTARRRSRRPAEAVARIAWVLPVMGVAGLLLVISGGLGDVILFYYSSVQVGGATTPLRFVDGANYAIASAEGFLTVTFPSTQQVAFSASVQGANGAYSSYSLDVIELQARTNTTTGWHAGLTVTQAMSATGLNGAYVFYCTSAPSGVSLAGTALVSGTDSAGDPWAIYAPTCAGTLVSLSLTAKAAGTAVALPALVFGTSELYVSFAVDVASGGVSGVTPANLVLSATSP